MFQEKYLRVWNYKIIPSISLELINDLKIIRVVVKGDSKKKVLFLIKENQEYKIKDFIKVTNYSEIYIKI